LASLEITRCDLLPWWVSLKALAHKPSQAGANGAIISLGKLGGKSQSNLPFCDERSTSTSATPALIIGATRGQQKLFS
jgi:hypothetical protein